MTHDAFPPYIAQLIRATAQATVDSLAKKLDLTRPCADDFNPRLLTVREASRYLSCSRATLRRYEESGRLLPKRFGRKVLYSVEDLDSFIRNPDDL